MIDKNWRPDDWERCPCDSCDRKVIDDYGYVCAVVCQERWAYFNREAGATAMLEALIDIEKLKGEVND